MSKYQTKLFKQPGLSSSRHLLSSTQFEHHSTSVRIFSPFFSLKKLCYVTNLAIIVATCRSAFYCVVVVLATLEAFHLRLRSTSSSPSLTTVTPILQPGLICFVFNITSVTSTSFVVTSSSTSRTLTLSVQSSI